LKYRYQHQINCIKIAKNFSIKKKLKPEQNTKLIYTYHEDSFPNFLYVFKRRILILVNGRTKISKEVKEYKHIKFFLLNGHFCYE